MLKASAEEKKDTTEEGAWMCPICKGRSNFLRVELDCTINKVYDVESGQCIDTEEAPLVYEERFFCINCESQLNEDQVNKL